MLEIAYHHYETRDSANQHDFLDTITTKNREDARLQRSEIRKQSLEIGGYQSVEEALWDLGPKTTIVHIAGGAASRWDNSFGDNTEYTNDNTFALRGEPRGLAQVPNLITHQGIDGTHIPVFAYSLWATQHIPQTNRYIIVPESISDENFSDMESWTEKMNTPAEFRSQKIRSGEQKPSGHGDAILQNADILKNTQYFIPQFVSDASSQSTITDTLLLLNALKKLNISVDMIAPTARVAEKYPFFVNNEGLPTQVGHAKLLGEESLSAGQLTPAESSVGLYLFDAKRFSEEMNGIAGQYEDNGNSYGFLPGHNGLNEFAIDDVNLALMSKKRARLFAISHPREIMHSAKTVPELGPFTEMMREIIAGDLKH